MAKTFGPIVAFRCLDKEVQDQTRSNFQHWSASPLSLSQALRDCWGSTQNGTAERLPQEAGVSEIRFAQSNYFIEPVASRAINQSRSCAAKRKVWCTTCAMVCSEDAQQVSRSPTGLGCSTQPRVITKWVWYDWSRRSSPDPLLQPCQEPSSPVKFGMASPLCFAQCPCLHRSYGSVHAPVSVLSSHSCV